MTGSHRDCAKAVCDGCGLFRRCGLSGLCGW